MSTIETKFGLGDRVWIITSAAAYRVVRCNVCGSTGRVVIHSEELVCPKCQGKGGTKQHAGTRWYREGSGRVGQIRCEKTAEKWRREEDEAETEIVYMLDTTGVRSGSLWEEEKLFGSEAEALAECDRRNAGLNFKDDDFRSPVTP